MGLDLTPGPISHFLSGGGDDERGSGSIAVATAPVSSMVTAKFEVATETRTEAVIEFKPTTEQKIEAFYGVKQVGDQVVFTAKFEQASKVLIAGDFNNWSPMSTPMVTSATPGLWVSKLPLYPGRYRYRLVVDGQWMTDPGNSYVESNQFGELNNIVEVI